MILEYADRSLASKERLLKRMEAQNRRIVMQRRGVDEGREIEQEFTTKRRGWKVLRQSIGETQRVQEAAARGVLNTGRVPLERRWKAKSLLWKEKWDARARRFAR